MGLDQVYQGAFPGTRAIRKIRVNKVWFYGRKSCNTFSEVFNLGLQVIISLANRVVTCIPVSDKVVTYWSVFARDMHSILYQNIYLYFMHEQLTAENSTRL